jgi:hypothetical protein
MKRPVHQWMLSWRLRFKLSMTNYRRLFVVAEVIVYRELIQLLFFCKLLKNCLVNGSDLPLIQNNRVLNVCGVVSAH